MFLQNPSSGMPREREDPPAVYGQLRRLAAAYLRREPRGHTLQPTALVNEALVRLLGQGSQDLNGPALIQAAARAMRHVLVDHARRKHALKRGPGESMRLPIQEDEWVVESSSLDMLALDEALHRLGQTDPQLLQLVELRFFGGLTEEQTGRCLGVSTRTVTRGWGFARLWLARELSKGDNT
jgi:RNA polymerase sigma factor (TIGR02999 family)